jgi:hypothetical protein
MINEFYHWSQRTGDSLPAARPPKPKDSEAATAALRPRKSSAAAGAGAGATGFVGLDNLSSPPAAIVLPPAESNFQLLTIEEFEKLIPLASPVDENGCSSVVATVAVPSDMVRCARWRPVPARRHPRHQDRAEACWLQVEPVGQKMGVPMVTTAGPDRHELAARIDRHL